jgi:hypothetical protein
MLHQKRPISPCRSDCPLRAIPDKCTFELHQWKDHGSEIPWSLLDREQPSVKRLPSSCKPWAKGNCSHMDSRPSRNARQLTWRFPSAYASRSADLAVRIGGPP